MDAARRSVATLAARVRHAHAARIWLPLGHNSWEAYCAVEFGVSRAQAYRLLDVARSLAAIHDAVTAGAETSRTRAINPATLDYGLSQRALIDVSSHSGGRPDRRRATRRRRRPRRSTHAIRELTLEVAPPTCPTQSRPTFWRRCARRSVSAYT
jgi:hypothetical protein